MPRLVLACLFLVALSGCGELYDTEPRNFDAEQAAAPPPEPKRPSIEALRGHPRVGAVLTKRARAVIEAPDRVFLYSIEPSEWREYGYGRNTDPSPLEHALGNLADGTGVLIDTAWVVARTSAAWSVTAGTGTDAFIVRRPSATLPVVATVGAAG